MLPDSSHCLLLVRSTLEVASVLRSLYPRLEAQIFSLEKEVESAGQQLLEAGSVPRARVALDRILQVRLALEKLSLQQDETPTAQTATAKVSASNVAPLTVKTGSY
jgi:hypothetical protein